MNLASTFSGDPRILTLWTQPQSAAVAASPLDDGLVGARRLRLRIEALERALADLPRQARRLVRWRLRREQAAGLKYFSPLRPGPPPGHRAKLAHQIDYVLAECHGLAHDALALNTS